jgi:hypothetical protein
MTSLDTADAGTVAAEPAARPVELRLARLHLRMGSLQLARAELESLAGGGQLDPDALLDLAEVRWRTDDLAGAGVAAHAYLGAGRDDLLAVVIAAEASAAAGHPGEARELVARVLERDGDIDAIFAGMPRSWMWPLEPTEEPTSVAELFPDAIRPMAGGPGLVPSPAAAGPSSTSAVDRRPMPGTASPPTEVVPVVASRTDAAHAPDLAAAREALDAGDATAAADRLAQVLRERPDLAATVLAALDPNAASGDPRRPETGAESAPPGHADPAER